VGDVVIIRAGDEEWEAAAGASADVLKVLKGVE
jgi:hypothetical protein